MRTSLLLAAFLLLPLLASFAVAAERPAPKIPVIFDTDIGDDIDDTWALVMLLKSPQFDVKLVTTTCGKAEYRAKIIAKILTMAKRTDISVGMGEGGRDGTGGQQAWVKDYKLSEFPGKVHQDGTAAMIELIEKSPEPLAVIAVGPLQTVAAALSRQPAIAGKALFVGMHGSVRKGYGGSPKLSAEYNVKADVAAARKVLSAPWKHISITPLDTCGLVNLSGQRFQTLRDSEDPLVKALLENYRVWAKKEQLSQLTASSILFDTAAVYLARRAEQRPLIEIETLSIAVTDDGFTRIDPAGAKMSVATAWKDLDGYRDLLVNILTGP